MIHKKIILLFGIGRLGHTDDNLVQSRVRFEPITNSLTVSSDDTLEDNVEFSIGTAILRVVGNLVQSCDHFESTQNDKLGISSHDT